MKKLLTICLILIWVVSFGCKQDQVISQLEVGKGKLLGMGLSIEAVKHLERAEQEEMNKVEPRALLLIAYSNALSTDMAKSYDLEAEYRSERTRRITELSTTEIKKILQILNERHRIQKDAIKILIDKGEDAIPLILEALHKTSYRDLEPTLLKILSEIGSEGLTQLFTAISNSETSPAVRINLIRVIGAIGDTGAVTQLESLQEAMSDAIVDLELNTALYKLGKETVKTEILQGLNAKRAEVRQAAAHAMSELNDVHTATLIKMLQDPNDTVRMNITKALQKHYDEAAVNSLVKILYNDSSWHTKKIASETLKLYAEKGLADKLAPQLVAVLIAQQVAEYEDRLRIVQLLIKPALLKQIQIADPYDNLPHKLDDYYRTKETNTMVKEELSNLLLKLE